MADITEIETIASQLADVGVPVDSVQIMAKIISTLPQKFDNFESSWASEAYKTIAYLASRLLKKARGGDEMAISLPLKIQLFFLVKALLVPMDQHSHMARQVDHTIVEHHECETLGEGNEVVSALANQGVN